MSNDSQICTRASPVGFIWHTTSLVTFSRFGYHVLAAADLDIAYGKFCLARLGWGAKTFREMLQREEEEDAEARAATVEERDSADLNCPPEIEGTDEDCLDPMFEECGCEPVRHLEPVRTFDDARVVFKAANPR